MKTLRIQNIHKNRNVHIDEGAVCKLMNVIIISLRSHDRRSVCWFQIKEMRKADIIRGSHFSGHYDVPNVQGTLRSYYVAAWTIHT